MNSLVQSFLDYRLVGLLKNDYVYNEFSLQHELGIYLRDELKKVNNDYMVQFERNVNNAFQGNGITIKKEMDIYIYNKSDANEKYAIELKFPRNGQYPVQMGCFVNDIDFMQDVKKIGKATGTFVLTLVDDDKFYSNRKPLETTGIYECFRDPNINGIYKPPQKVNNKYQIEWKPIIGADPKYRYYFLEIN